MFYQKQPQTQFYFRMYEKNWNRINTHIHGFFELHCCTGGVLHITVAGREYELKVGEAALVFPYQPHSFPGKEGEGYFFTFEPELIAAFAEKFANRLPQNNSFSFTYDFESVSEKSDLYAVKSFLYAMCSCASQMAFEPATTTGRALLEKLLMITEENFRDSDFSLGKLSRLLGYDYGYVSKYFFHKTGTKFNDYLNQRRVAYAISLLDRGDVDYIGDVALACGYGSIRSFNRNFKVVEGVTPKAYRMGKK